MLLALLLAIPVQWLGFAGIAGAAGGYPDSCQAVVNANPSAPDGEYFILVSGKPVQLFCADMSTSPKEYITLVNTGGTYNFSHYAVVGTDVKTSYTRIRFNPLTLKVDTTDLTFSNSAGVIHSPYITSVSFGTAADCIAPGSSTGTGNINLAGTPFAVAAGEFTTTGVSPAGTANYSAANQIVDLTGGGNCGSTDSGPDLQLELNGPTFALSTSSAHSGQATLAITYPTGAVQQKFRQDGGFEQSYGGTFLIPGNHTFTAYSYDSNGIKSAENRIVVSSTAANLEMSLSTSGLSQGQTGAQYTINVANVGSAATDGTSVAVKVQLPSELTATGISGTGWSCTLSSLICSRSDALSASGSYPQITLTVDVAPNAPTSVTAGATVSGGGEVGVSNNYKGLATTVVKKPDLTLTKTHTGTLWQGKTGVVYTLTVKNSGGAATDGTAVTVTDTLPAELTAVSLDGVGWSCTLGTLTCTRTDTLAASGTYPVIQLVADVSAGAALTTLTNTATVTGGGDSYSANNMAADAAAVLSSNAYLSALSLITSSGIDITGFSKLTTSYSASVGYNDSFVSVSPTADYSGATLRVRVNGGTYAAASSGMSTQPLALTVGANTIDVEVTAENADTKLTYTINVNRKSDNALLSGLTLTSGLSGFNPQIFDYSTAVPHSTSSLQVTPTLQHSNASVAVRINGGAYSAVTSGAPSSALALNEGLNTIDVMVKAEDSHFYRLYRVNVTRAAAWNTNADLSALTLSTGWSGYTGATNYTLSVSNDVYQITVTPTAVDPHASIAVKVNDGSFMSVTSGVYSSALPLLTGYNVVQIQVTAQDGTTSKLYTLTIHRAISGVFGLLEQEVSADGSRVRILFSDAVQTGTIHASKFVLRADGKAITVASATYDSLDASGRSVNLFLATPIVYGQKVTLEIQQGAVTSLAGEALPARAAEWLVNKAEYDQVSVVALLRLELLAYDTGNDGIQVSELLLWINHYGKDITGDTVFNVQDIHLLLKQIASRTVTT